MTDMLKSQKEEVVQAELAGAQGQRCWEQKETVIALHFSATVQENARLRGAIVKKTLSLAILIAVVKSVQIDHKI